MKTSYIFFISIFSLSVGILIYAIYNDIIIIKWPSKNTQNITQNINSQKKIFKLSYWKNNRWNTEEKELLSSQNKITTLTYLITSWLNLLDEEQLMIKKVSLQTVLLDASGSEAYISFDRNPFDKESSTFQKLIMIEGLLKTLRENNLNLNSVYFLVHNRPINDPHLDFSQSWPIIGFL